MNFLLFFIQSKLKSHIWLQYCLPAKFMSKLKQISCLSCRYLRLLLNALWVVSVLALTACASPNPHQVNTSTQNIIINEQGVPNRYLVKSGDTVSRIAQRYGLNYREIGRLNQLDSHYTIYAGTWLTLWNARTNTSYLPSNQNIKVAKGFMLPSHNRVIGEFNKSNGIIGMWFEGQLNDPVLASQDGKVLYVGESLKDYGKLIMLEHGNGVVTAYAHNNRLLVSQDELVKRGQPIATMGHIATHSAIRNNMAVNGMAANNNANNNNNVNVVALEFQVRLHGEPIDPRSILTN